MCMALSIPRLQRYVDIIAFSIVMHVGFSINYHFFILFLLRRTVLTTVLFLYNLGGYSLKKFELQSPIAVANFIIDVAKKEENPVTNLKFQKILFFLQGYCLNKYNRTLFDGKFAKWQYGPVEEEIYQIFKSQWSMPINSPGTQMRIENGVIELYHKEINLPQEYTEKLKSIVIKINQKAPWELYELTHKHSSWYSYKDDISRGIASDYTNNEIEKCFKDNFRGMLNRLG
ncbi:DUF4065 domain-containing protein [Lactobacillus salivarius]|nr:DUF4065 domain-containing protein [Ligilactobacillus salivarius]